MFDDVFKVKKREEQKYRSLESEYREQMNKNVSRGLEGDGGQRYT